MQFQIMFPYFYFVFCRASVSYDPVPVLVSCGEAGCGLDQMAGTRGGILRVTERLCCQGGSSLSISIQHSPNISLLRWGHLHPPPLPPPVRYIVDPSLLRMGLGSIPVVCPYK